MSRPTILFDLDGTLIDSTNSILNGFFAAFDTFKFKRPQIEEICALIGHPLDYMFAHLGVNDEAVWDFVAVYKETYKKTYLQDTKLLDFAKESIELANEFADIGVVTTKTSKYSVILLDHLGVGKYFKTVIGKDDVINPKPHPEPILKALLNLDKTDKFAYMVGDTPMDAKAAKSANVISVGVTCGYCTEQNLSKYCDHVAKNSLEAVKFIRSDTL